MTARRPDRPADPVSKERALAPDSEETRDPDVTAHAESNEVDRP